MKKKVVIAALSALALGLPANAYAVTPDADGAAKPAKVDASVLPRSLDDNAQVHVMVQLGDDPVTVVQAKKGRKLSADEKAAVRAQLKAKQDPVASAARSKGATVTGELQSAYNGVQVTIARSQVASLASLPGVVGVHALREVGPQNATSIPYLGVPQVWQNTGYTGKGVKLGIIDTGIDYTHADFGGPGTVAAYEKAKATDASAPDPALMGPSAPRVKGGYDFVGDNYDAGGKEGSTTPAPDPNPLDCTDTGHGSHVAGSAAGSGVTPDGKTYTGPYDASTATKEWKVGPGVAPQADLYSYRVLSCKGTTVETVKAIDRAVADGMDVISMSLGSPIGLPDDPEAVAASNAVGAGVVVVAAAGNNGPSPYLTGSPATGSGVISVAAMDSTKSFPGATLTANGKTIQVLNENGYAPLPTTPYTAVVLKDIAGTPENESLGCSTQAFTANGIKPGLNQLAIARRGDCARVARAIHGQEAGAAAVLMANYLPNYPGYPPFDGPITQDPDTGEALKVTIPFFGSAGEDADFVLGLDGAKVTFADKPLPNPNYTKYADFTSGGARAGDSAVAPLVTAPGVSIYSAHVGTGTEAWAMSGTSMATPETSGLAVLVKQAHPGWSAQDITAALVTTASAARTGDYAVTRGGQGEIRPAAAVAASSVMLGDQATTANGATFRVPSISFGFVEPATTTTLTRDVYVKNNGTATRSYTLSVKPSPQSEAATVSVSPKTLTVAPGAMGKATVTMVIDPTKIGSSEGDGFQFYEISGSIQATASNGESFGVPYLAVPRPQAQVSVKLAGQLNNRAKGATATFTDASAVPATVRTFAWGISDPQDLPVATHTAGMDVRAVGASYDKASGDLSFAVNSWTRYSTAAQIEHDIKIDTNADGAPDYVLFTTDHGYMTASYADGVPATFLANVATGDVEQVSWTVAPTDSATVLMSVPLTKLGLSTGHAAFKYTVQSYSWYDATTDDTSAWGSYDADAAPIIGEGQSGSVSKGHPLTLKLPYTKAAKAGYAPLGVMAVVFDNAATNEALLIPAK